MTDDIRKILENVQNGSLSVDDALLSLKKEPFEDIGYAKGRPRSFTGPARPRSRSSGS